MVGDAEAYVAACDRREPRGPNGESHLASIWHTLDGGVTWRPVAWRRAIRVFASRAVFAPWPPEYVVAMALRERAVEIEFWEDWGMDGTPGEDMDTGHRTEPIWRARLVGGRWSIRMDRRWSTRDGTFGPRGLELDLPGFRPPSFAPRVRREEAIFQRARGCAMVRA